MYIHIGSKITLNTKHILGIFDIETSTTSKITKDFLARAQLDGKIISVGDDLPKSFIIYKDTIYLTHISALILRKRAYLI